MTENNNGKSISYKDAGVDVEAGYKAVELMKKHVKSTFDTNVLGDIGSFGGFYNIANSPELNDEPILVAGTDGVGTKLKYAFLTDKHDTIGIDCVAMCVNDVVCQGARPLFFLDYFATGKLNPSTCAEVVGGVAAGCREAGCALIGGETAEMPGFYPEGEYDLAGFAVGIVSRSKVINGQSIVAGDKLIGLPSSGIHSNGFSLVRKIFGEDKCALKRETEFDYHQLLAPTRIYVKLILDLIAKFNIKGIAHITGGGFIENIPRIFPSGIGARINTKAYPVPEIFQIIKRRAALDDRQIYNTLNMGIGMVLAIAPTEASAILEYLSAKGETAYIIGETVSGGGIVLE